MADDLRQYPPTSRRLRKLHEAGIFPYSRVLTAAVVFLAALMAAAAVGPLLLESLGNVLRAALGQAQSFGAVGQQPLAVQKVQKSVLHLGGQVAKGLLCQFRQSNLPQVLFQATEKVRRELGQSIAFVPTDLFFVYKVVLLV